MDFSAFNKRSASRFNEQKALLKKLSKGHTVKCEVCQHTVTLYIDEQAQQGHAKCKNACTDILLDLAG